MSSEANGVVSFNVGGQTFTTLKETLLKEANSRLALVARGLLAAVRDPVSGAFVLDRDPKYFQLILNWLRDGWCSLPRSPEARRELLQEVRYYQLTTFEGWLRTQEVISETGARPDVLTLESPRAQAANHFAHRPSLGTAAPQPAFNIYTPYPTYGSPASAPPGPASPRQAAAGAPMAVSRGPPAIAWLSSGPPAPVASPLPSSSHLHPNTFGSTSPARGALGYGAPVGSSNGHGYANGGIMAAPGSAILALREAFLAATAPQRPAQHVAPYSLSATADDSTSWTSKYLKGNEQLRELVNTLLELAFLAPHRVLNGGKVHMNINVACGHGSETSLVSPKDDYQRTKLLELRVRGALGWAFELVLRPSSEIVLWDKYGGVAASVQDNWFVLGAILKDQFGIVMEEDASARPACMACRRTCLAITLRKIY